MPLGLLSHQKVKFISNIIYIYDKYTVKICVTSLIYDRVSVFVLFHIFFNIVVTVNDIIDDFHKKNYLSNNIWKEFRPPKV